MHKGKVKSILKKTMPILRVKIWHHGTKSDENLPASGYNTTVLIRNRIISKNNIKMERIKDSRRKNIAMKYGT